MGRRSLIWVVVASAWAGLSLAGCPNATSLSPCTCDYYGINCMRAQSAGQLRRAFRSGDEFSREHRDLWIQSTPIESFKAGVLGLFKFQNVHIERNVNLSSFTLDSLMHIRLVMSALSLYGNALQTFEYDKFARFTGLVSLNLGGNKLSRIPPNAFRSIRLKRLSLSENPITYIGAAAFFALPNLTELQLSHTRLKIVGDHSLSFMRASRKLKIDLSHSAITTFHYTAFDAAAPVEVNLSHNNLTALDKEPFESLIYRMYTNVRGLSLRPVINVQGNPLTCQGCSYMWLIHSRIRRKLLGDILEGFKCPDGSGVSGLANRKIKCTAPFSTLNLG